MANYKILFIDDDPHVLRSLGEYFERVGHEVYRAPSGAEGVKMWKQVQPDVTVLDIHMPGMNGIEVLRELRKQRATVIMLTAYGEVNTAVEAMRLGAENFLTKPIDMDHLTQAVEKAAEKTQLRRENIVLRERLTPTFKRQAVRFALLTILVAISLGIGAIIGGGEAERPTRPIPIPIDTTPSAPPGGVLP